MLGRRRRASCGEWLDRQSGRLMVLPAVLILLCFAIFPLIVSAYLSLSRFALAPGGFTLNFIGLLNFKKLLIGSQQYHFLGTFGRSARSRWLVLVAGRRGAAALRSAATVRRRRHRCSARIGRLISAALAVGAGAARRSPPSSPAAFPARCVTT